ncbi:MAG: sensor histidine kinase [Cocleimonas sp.]|nr:sensor histidine kinase [Cocleimonas sp.]
MRSLQSRLHLGLGISLFIITVLVWWLVNTSISHISHQMMLTRIEHDGQALLAGLQQSPEGKLGLKKLQVGHIYRQVFSGHYYLISSDKLQLRSHSLWDQTLQQPLVKTGETIVQSVDGPDGQRLLQWTSRFERFNHAISITVAEDTNDLLSALRTFNLYFALAAVLIFISLLLIQGLIVRQSLRSLSAIKQQLQALSTGEIKSLSKQVPSEILPLVDEVNHLLRQLSKQLKRSRNSTGNLAHSLKHPLNLLMQLAESEDTKLPKEVRDELHINTQQILQLMERELKRARLVGSGLPGQRFSPHKELAGLVDVLQRVYHDKNLNIECDILPQLGLSADRNDMLELFGNLLDNACKWSAGQVRCKVYHDTSLIIQIEDDGIGCDDQQLSTLTQRGVRADETTAGSGLGLAIVKDIVELYLGEIEFSRSELGGLSVLVSLPIGS